jgi:hypothetical protein
MKRFQPFVILGLHLRHIRESSGGSVSVALLQNGILNFFASVCSTSLPPCVHATT